jgi:hypothetical protein
MALNPPSTGKNGRRRTASSSASDTDSFGEEYKVGPGRPPKEFQFKPGQSGNPKGAKRKTPSIATDLKALLEHALSKKVKLKQGEKEQIVTKAAAGIEQLVNQFAKGDHRARRDLITLADTLGVDLMAGQRKAIEDVLAPNHQATLDAYVARRKDVHGSSSSVRILAPPELLDDDSEDQDKEQTRHARSLVR